MKIKFIIAVLFFFSLAVLLNLSSVSGQIRDIADYPIPGRLIPEFKLNKVQYYSKETFTPDDAKGKWLILDFWSKGCTACVQSFPKLDSLQNQFKEDVQFLLIGHNNKSNRNIEKDYERYRKHFNLNLPIAYDSILFQQFGIQSVPYVVIVNPEKKVFSITSSDEITKESLHSMIDGNAPVFRRVTSRLEKSTSLPKWEPFGKHEIATATILFKSVLAKNDGEPSNGDFYIDTNVLEKLTYQPARISLMDLYRVAYFPSDYGTQSQEHLYWHYPILKTRDSIRFFPNSKSNSGLFNYGLLIPKEKAKAATIQRMMQNDLSNCFGYNVHIEKRMMPYYRLTATDKARARLKVKHGYSSFSESPTGINANNVSIESILLWIGLYNGNSNLPLIDETNLGRNIAIRLVAVMTDIKDVTKALMSHGLILEKSKREMNVLVISDPNIKNN